MLAPVLASLWQRLGRCLRGQPECPVRRRLCGCLLMATRQPHRSDNGPEPAWGSRRSTHRPAACAACGSKMCRPPNNPRRRPARRRFACDRPIRRSSSARPDQAMLRLVWPRALAWSGPLATMSRRRGMAGRAPLALCVRISLRSPVRRHRPAMAMVRRKAATVRLHAPRLPTALRPRPTSRYTRITEHCR
jgi:hypothetical protein